MDREYDPGKHDNEAILKKKNPLYFPGVVIGDNQILPNLSASVLASILGLFINSKLDLSSVCFFFRPQRLKYPVQTVAGGFVCAKKVWQTREGTMSSPSLFLIHSRGIFLNFSSSPPPPKKTASKAALCSRLVGRCYFVFVGQVRYCLVIGQIYDCFGLQHALLH